LGFINRAALVVPDEVFHVLQHEGGRLVVIKNLGDGEEEVALFLVRKAVLAAEAVLLGDAREAEGLAGKAAAQNVELRDVGHGHGMDVAVRGLAEVGGVGLPRILVPVAGEDAPCARALEGEPKAADAAEEVNEAQGGTLTYLTPHPGTLPSGRRGRRIGAVGRGLLLCLQGGAVLLRRPVFSSVTLGGGRDSPAAEHRRPTGAGLGTAAHASTPSQSWAVVRRRALASRATFRMPGLRSPRSMPEM